MNHSLSIGVSGLRSFQTAMNVTSNNIANANTEGYTKQQVNLNATPAIKSNNHKIGTGVEVSSINRVHDTGLFNNLKKATENYHKDNEHYTHLNQVRETLVGEGLDGNNITDMVDEWFGKLQNLAANPNSNAIKEDLKINGEAVINRGTQLNNVLSDYKESLIDKKEYHINEARGYMEQISKLTKDIRQTSSKNQSNDLMDQINLLEMKLSKLGEFKAYVNEGDNNNNLGADYNFTFTENSGKLAGLNKSIESIENLQNTFNNTFGPIGDKINEFITSDMSNPNEMIQWAYDENPSKNIASTFVSFSSETDVAKGLSVGNNAILNSYQEQHDQTSKVNLDEELINMMKYQRAYEAMAKVIEVSDEMMKTTINMVA